jgi:hypothetical protein
MNSKGRSRAKLALTILLAAFLSACASAPSVPQNLRVETDDLGMVADWAIRMADDHGAGNILVVFDIDNTLLAMEQGLGSDQWYYWQKDLEKDDPCSPQLAGQRFAVQGALFHASAMRATQPDTAEQVRRIQEAGIPTIALTSRGVDYRLQTFRELRRQGISFWASAIPPQRGWTAPFLPDNGLRPVLYEDGVFLIAGQHKGQMMKTLLDRTGYEHPAVIIIADDKQQNLNDMMETFAGSGTWVHAWRYTREDANVAAFDPEKAAAQWDALRPALEVIEGVLGADNFSLPESTTKPECASP